MAEAVDGFEARLGHEVCGRIDGEVELGEGREGGGAAVEPVATVVGKAEDLERELVDCERREGDVPDCGDDGVHVLAGLGAGGRVALARVAHQEDVLEGLHVVVGTFGVGYLEVLEVRQALEGLLDQGGAGVECWQVVRFALLLVVLENILEEDGPLFGEKGIGADGAVLLGFGEVEGDGIDGPVEAVVVGNRM